MVMIMMMEPYAHIYVYISMNNNKCQTVLTLNKRYSIDSFSFFSSSLSLTYAAYR